MNKIYRTVYNAATGTWVVASELAKGRKKSSKGALVLAMAALLALPAGAAFAADDADEEDEVVEHKHTPLDVVPTLGGTGSIGTMATATELADLIKFGAGTGAAAASGPGSVALGANTRATGNYSVAIGGATTTDALGGRGAFAGGNSSVAIGVVSEARAANSVALGANSLADRANTVSVGAVNNRDGSSFTRQIVNVGAGTEDNDAVNLGQMKAALSTKVDDTVIKVGGTTASTVSGHVNNIAIGAGANSAGAAGGSASIAFGTNASSTNAGTVAIGADSAATASGAVALGLRSSASAAGSVALGLDSTATENNTVSVGNATTQRRIVNLADGTADTDAVNVRQLNAVDGRVTTVTSNVTALTGRVDTAEGNIKDLQDAMDSGSVGLVQQAAAGAELTVGKDTDGTSVNFAGTAGNRTLTGVADGSVSAASSDAINGSQLHAVSTSVADAIGAGSTVNADGSISAPSFTVGDGSGGTTTVHNLGDVVTNINSRVTDNESAIGSIRDEMDSGTIGLVQQAAAGEKLTVGANTDGTEVDFTGTDGVRKLTGIADGTLSDTSTDAVTGKQLNATNINVTNLGDRVDTAEDNIKGLKDAMDSGSVGLVQQNATTGEITVANTTGGSVVNFAGTDGNRVLTGLGNGVNDSDAVTLAQLKASGLVDKDGKELGAVVYDDMTLSSVSLGGDPTFGTFLNNVRAGEISATSMQAVNGSQLFAMKEEYDRKLGDLDGRVKDIEDGSGVGPGLPPPGEGGGVEEGKGGPGSIVVGDGADASGKNSSAIGSGAVASGENSSAIGNGAVASGKDSTAIGQGAKATGENSVALGAGSVADRDNEVSIGAPGQERFLGNVKDGERDTDAVNVRQLNNAVGNLQNQIDTNRRDAAGGTATAVAIANLPQASLPGESVMSLASGTYDGESAMAIGISTATRDGKWLLKASGSTNTRGSSAVGAGVGYRW